MHANTKLLAVGLLILCSMVFPLVPEAIGQNGDKGLDKFQGTWVMVSGERDGKKISDEDVSKSKITYQGNQGQLIAPHQHGEAIFFEVLKIDPTKSPKEFSLIRKNGPSAGKTITGIYEFKGDDQFTFAFDPAAAATPKEFSAKEGTGHIVQTWKRSKP